MKALIKTVLIPLVLFTLSLASYSCTTVPPGHSTGCTEKISIDFEGYGFGGLDKDIAIWAFDAIKQTKDPIDTNNSVVRFKVKKGDIWFGDLVKNKDTERAELSEWGVCHVPFEKDLWYSFRVFIPTDWPNENNRCVIAQWHGIPPENGEISRSPHLKIEYRDDYFLIKLNYCKIKLPASENDIGCKKIKLDNTVVQKGVWHKFIVNVKWSPNNGYLNLWIDKKLYVLYRGAIGHNDDIGPFFKMGIYRNTTDYTYEIYFDNYKRGTTYSEIGIENPFLDINSDFVVTPADCSKGE